MNLIAPLTTILCSPAPLFWKLLTARPPTQTPHSVRSKASQDCYWSSATNSLTRKPSKAWYNKHGLQMGISCNFTTSIQNWRWSPNVYYFESSRTVNDSRTFGHCSNNPKCSNPWELQHIARSLTCTTGCAGPGTSNWEWNFNMLIAKDSLAKGVSVSMLGR